MFGCMDLKTSGHGPDTKSKHGPERGQHLTGFDDFGANQKPCLSAVQRGQNHQNLISTDPVHGHALIWLGPGPGPHFGPFLPGLYIQECM